MLSFSVPHLLFLFCLHDCCFFQSEVEVNNVMNLLWKKKTHGKKPQQKLATTKRRSMFDFFVSCCSVTLSVYRLLKHALRYIMSKSRVPLLYALQSYAVKAIKCINKLRFFSKTIIVFF